VIVHHLLPSITPSYHHACSLKKARKRKESNFRVLILHTWRTRTTLQVEAEITLAQSSHCRDFQSEVRTLSDLYFFAYLDLLKSKPERKVSRNKGRQSCFESCHQVFCIGILSCVHQARANSGLFALNRRSTKACNVKLTQLMIR